MNIVGAYHCHAMCVCVLCKERVEESPVEICLLRFLSCILGRNSGCVETRKAVSLLVGLS